MIVQYGRRCAVCQGLRDVDIERTGVLDSARSRAVRGETSTQGLGHSVKVCVLGSGSSGNATLITADGTSLLVDAGLSCRQITQRLRAVGADPRSVNAVLVTHEHRDHIAGLPTFVKQFNPTVYVTEATAAAAGDAINGAAAVEFIEAGAACQCGPLDVHPFSVAHDATDAVGYVVSNGDVSVGIATDLGFASAIVKHRLRGCDLTVVEANHDPRMLREGRYPWHLKQRIASRHGHLSNGDCAMLVAELVPDGTKCVVLAHISADNNRPELAVQTVEEELAARGLDDVHVLVAPRSEPTPVITVRPAGVSTADTIGC